MILGKTRLLVGDVRSRLADIPDESVHCVVTSPPYFGLRDYSAAGQIGLEPTIDEYLSTMVSVFRGLWRVLRKDGTVWLNLGDSYNAGRNGGHSGGPKQASHARHNGINRSGANVSGLKPKDLIGMPWRVAFVLQDDGWYLRSEIIWDKPNIMPDSVKDRPTRSHETIFLLTKSERYYYDNMAILEEFADARRGNPGVYARTPSADKKAATGRQDLGFLNNGGGWNAGGEKSGRNKRSVWRVTAEPQSSGHYATFPTALIEPCIRAGTSERGVCAKCGAPYGRIIKVGTHTGSYHDHSADLVAGMSQKQPAKLSGSDFIRDYVAPKTIGWKPSCKCGAEIVPAIVLDPFMGSGTTGVVCAVLRRNCVGVELNADYAKKAVARINKRGGLLHKATLEAEP